MKKYYNFELALTDDHGTIVAIVPFKQAITEEAIADLKSINKLDMEEEIAKIIKESDIKSMITRLFMQTS